LATTFALRAINDHHESPKSWEVISKFVSFHLTLSAAAREQLAPDHPWSRSELVFSCTWATALSSHEEKEEEEKS
jgi:hypothetical protein